MVLASGKVGFILGASLIDDVVIPVALVFVSEAFGASGVVVVDGVLLVLSDETLFPVRPSMASPFGSTPKGGPVFNPSAPRICGTSSRFSGLTTWAVTMNISSLSF